MSTLEMSRIALIFGSNTDMDDWTELDFSSLRHMRAPDRPLRVGALPAEHDAYNCFRQLPAKSCPKPGAEIEIMAMVLQMLGWNWTMIDLHEEYGIQIEDFGEELPNGTFTGAMGFLQAEKIDIFALTMRITSNRMKAACFSYPLHIVTQVYIITAPRAVDFRYFMFSVLTLDVWLVILGTVVILIVIQTIIYIYEDTCKKTLFEKAGRAFMETMGVFLKQRGSNPRSHTEMVLQAFMLLTLVVLAVYYQSSMNSKLTSPSRPAIPFKTQSQLLNVLDRGDMFLMYPMNNTLECSNKANCKRMHRILKKNPLRIASEAETPDMLKRGGIMFSSADVDLVPHDISWYNRKADTIMVKDPTGLHFNMGFSFSIKNRPYKNTFNKALVRILPGIPKLMQGPGYHRTQPNYFSTMKAKKVSLSITKHLEQLFETYLIGCGIAIAVFIIEVVLHHSKLNHHIAEECDRKLSGRYISGMRVLRWFPQYSMQELQTRRSESYTAVNCF